MQIRALASRIFGSPLTRRLLLALMLGLMLAAGVKIRDRTWHESRHLRFQRDLVNGFYWGTQTLKEAQRHAAGEVSWPAFWRGYTGLYDRVKRNAYAGQYQLDYPPLRLLVMSLWTKEVRRNYPGVDEAHPGYVRPLLNLNLLAEALSALATFLLVRYWVGRAPPSESRLLRELPAESRGTVCGLAAASAVWLEPSMILDAHGWPQWDVWILPFYFFAALAASKKQWFQTGALLAVGAMFKGQLLIVAPFFFLWPLCQREWKSFGRILAGFLTAAALVVSPWLLGTPMAWISVVAVALISLGIFRRLHIGDRGAWSAGLAAAAAFLVGAFAGSYAWLQIGFLYGSEHYPYLFISSCYNLPSLLAQVGLALKKPFWSLHLGALTISLTLQWTLRLFYLGGLILCARAAAQFQRRPDPRLLIAIATPWLLMFALLAQMHERYLLWGAVASAVAFGVSGRMSILHLIFAIASMVMIVNVMVMDQKLSPNIASIDLFDRIRPFASGFVLACVGWWTWSLISRGSGAFRKGDSQSGAGFQGVDGAPASQRINVA